MLATWLWELHWPREQKITFQINTKTFWMCRFASWNVVIPETLCLWNVNVFSKILLCFLKCCFVFWNIVLFSEMLLLCANSVVYLEMLSCFTSQGHCREWLTVSQTLFFQLKFNSVKAIMVPGDKCYWLQLFCDFSFHTTDTFWVKWLNSHMNSCPN